MIDGLTNNDYTFHASDLVQGFSDANGNALSLVGAVTADNGTVVDHHDGSYTLTPTHDYMGQVSFAYTVGDAFGGSVAGSISAVINNAAPELTGAQAAMASGTEDTAYLLTANALSSGFTDANGDALSIVDVSSSNGSATDNGDGSWTFLGDANYNGAVDLSFTLADIHGATVTGNQSFSLAAVNDAPTSDNTILVDQTAQSRLPYSFTLPLGSFTDIDSPSLSYSASMADGSALPTWLHFDAATQTFSGNPTDTDLGTLSVKVVANDGHLSSPGLFNLTVAYNTTWMGTTGDDTLTGTDVSETFYGLAGNDSIDGGNGSDLMIGGAGDDIYATDTGNVDLFGNPTVDTIVETAGGGIDSVYSVYSYTLGSINDPVSGANNYVENLFLLSAGVKGTGNELDNYIEGNALANTLVGGLGNDTLYGGSGADNMTGDLAGGAGVGGNDTYYVDNINDKTIEFANGGTDTVYALINNITLQANVENLNLSKGGAAVTATGNTQDNVITGNANANVLNGGAGNDTLIGSAGNDTLNGGLGADTMNGGTQNDTYIVDNIGDVVTEALNAGTDTVQTTISYTLTTNVERLFLDSIVNANINGTGNALANTITGNAGINRIDGGLGADQLTGGAGADQFVFSTAVSAANVDTILDFNAASGDTIRLTGTVFAHLNQTNAVLNAADFHSGTGATFAATTASQHILFDTATHGLFYDADGSGAGAAVQFAVLAGVASLTAAAFFVEGTSSPLMLDPGAPMILG
jgi:serralysin